MKKVKFRGKARAEHILVLGIVLIVIIAILVLMLGPSRPDSLTCKDAKTSIMINRPLYSLCYNKETKQPFWILQFPDAGCFEITPNESPNNYYQDLDIPKGEQASELDYKKSHWVMSTFLFPFTKQDKELSGDNGHDLYLFSVTSPQDPEFHNGYWGKLRNRVKTLAERRKLSLPNKVAVLSGPLFLSENETIFGVNHIPVPTHFFQVIAPTANIDDIEIYIVPNKKIDEKISLNDFKVTIKEFEKKSGIKKADSIAADLEAVIMPL